MAREVAERPLGGIEGQEESSSAWRHPLVIALLRLRRKKLALIGLFFIVLCFSAGTLAPVLSWVDAIPNYTEQDLEQALQGPSWSHLFGTDRLGRDQLSRVIWSLQTTVIITICTLVTGGIVLAVGLGLLSGYVGGWLDSLIMRVGDVFASLPGLLMLILINATLKPQVRSVAREFEELTGIGGVVQSGAPDYLLIFGALSLFGWVGTARLIRSQILALRETEFILAAQSLGASTSRVIYRHLLPNVTNIIIVGMSLGLAGIAGSEIVLTWFGVGIQPPRPSFGALLFDSQGVRQLNAHPHLLLFPGLVVTVLFFSFNLLGDALADLLTPRTK